MTVQDFIRDAQKLAREHPEFLPFSKETIESLRMGLYCPRHEEDADRVLDTFPQLKARLKQKLTPYAVLPTSNDSVRMFELCRDPKGWTVSESMFSTFCTPSDSSEEWPRGWDEGEGPVLMVFDPLDALTLYDAGAKVVYFNSNTLKTLPDRLKSKVLRCSPIIIPSGYKHISERKISLDAARDVSKLFTDKGVIVSVFDEEVEYPGAWKMKKKGESLEVFLSAVYAYLDQGKDQRLEEYRAGRVSAFIPAFRESILKEGSMIPNSTGFSRLDKALDGGLYPGLYVLGANSSLGKTTLALQIADYVSCHTDVLFFSTEQSLQELMAKSISRLSYIHSNDIDKPFTAMQILSRSNPIKGRALDYLNDCITSYGETSELLYIIEGDSTREGNDTRVGIDTIRTMIPQHIEITGKKPVVFIDYLQILYPDDVTGKNSDKKNIDLMVSELRRISKDQGVTIFLISSKNRASYTGSTDMGGFKESGSIEYSADVILELQPEGMEQTDSPKSKSNDVERLKETRASAERRMMLEISKNRMGRTHRGIPLVYHAAYNLFEEIPEPMNTHSYARL